MNQMTRVHHKKKSVAVPNLVRVETATGTGTVTALALPTGCNRLTRVGSARSGSIMFNCNKMLDCERVSSCVVQVLQMAKRVSTRLGAGPSASSRLIGRYP